MFSRLRRVEEELARLAAHVDDLSRRVRYLECGSPSASEKRARVVQDDGHKSRARSYVFPNR